MCCGGMTRIEYDRSTPLLPRFAAEESLMKRLLLLLSSLVAVAGALGLVVFGGSIVGVFDGVMTHRIVDPPEPLPDSLAELGATALSGVAIALGLAVSCVATAMRFGQRTISVPGKALLAVAGVLILLGTMPLWWALSGAKADFRAIAASAGAPKPETTRAMAQEAAFPLAAGYAVWVVAAALSLAGGQVGSRAKPSPATGTRSVLAALAALGGVGLGVAASVLFLGIWLHGAALEGMLAGSVATPKPAELARNLAGVLDRARLAFLLVGCQGVMQAVAAVFSPWPPRGPTDPLGVPGATP